MAKLPLLFIVFVAFTGLTEGAGVLPDGPLNAAVDGTFLFSTSLTPTETPFVSVSWSFGVNTTIITSHAGGNTIPPEYEGRITLFLSTGFLELRNLTDADSGEYNVNIIPFTGEASSGRTTLNIYDPVSSIAVLPKSADVVEFTSVNLSCSSFGSSISFLWLNDTSEVTASDRVHLTDGGSTLTIVNVTRYDQQPFRCRVFNPVSNGTSDPVNIMVSFGPENTNLLLSPPEEYFAEGSNVRLICSTESGPPAQFLWFLNGESLLHTEPELILTNIQMNNAGNYSCQTFNNKTMRNETSEPRAISVLEQSSGCSAGCIAGIVIACCVLIAGAVGVGFYVYRKKKPPKTSSRRNTSTGDKGKDNTGYSSEEVNYADVRFLRNKNGGEVQLGLQNTSSDYAQVRVNSGPPAAASPPNYDAHMQRVKTQAPQAGTNGVQSEA